MMDGNLTLVSEPEVGSVFRAEIPLQKISDLERESKQIEIKINSYKGDQKRILIVDDNQSNVSLLVSLLEPINFVVEIAENGQVALQKCIAQKPDMVLLDYRMPVMDGYEFAQIVRKDEKLKDIKIIGVSATVHQKELKKQFLEICNDFVPKPVEIDLLLSKMQQILQIEWILENSPERHEAADATELLLPEPSIVATILENAEMGDFNSINHIIDNLLAMNPKYQNFHQQIKKLTKNYDSDGIVKFLT